LYHQVLICLRLGLLNWFSTKLGDKGEKEVLENRVNDESVSVEDEQLEGLGSVCDQLPLNEHQESDDWNALEAVEFQLWWSH
jgi:hypothetical protein